MRYLSRSNEFFVILSRNLVFDWTVRTWALLDGIFHVSTTHVDNVRAKYLHS